LVKRDQVRKPQGWAGGIRSAKNAKVCQLEIQVEKRVYCCEDLSFSRILIRGR
jgi:hypothetical protein